MGFLTTTIVPSSLLLLIAISKIQLTVSLYSKCEGEVYTIYARSSNDSLTSSSIVFTENCTRLNLFCHDDSGCTESPPQIGNDDFYCPGTAAGKFTKLGQCQQYFECEDGNAETKSCKNGEFFEPAIRNCIPGYIVNKSTTCYNGRLSCQRPSIAGHLYYQPHPTDPMVYIACVNNRTLFTGGCETYFDFTTLRCAEWEM